MLIRWLVAALHLLALAIGLGAVWARGRALRSPLDASGLRWMFSADTLWGVAAILWIATGLLRAFAGLEKGTAYYLQHYAFWIKMALLGCILLLEVWPMITLIRWRMLRARGQQLDTRSAPVFARISEVQALLIIAMVFAATAMAWGLGFYRSAP
jgi:putative membrane protein